MSLLQACVLAVLLVACGSKDDESKDESDPYEGTYAVTGRTLNEESCEAEGPAADADPAFFQLSLEQASQGNALVYYKCTEATSCQTDAFVSGWYFDAKIDDQWSGVATAAVAQKSEGKCFISLTTNTAVLTGAGLRMERRNSTGEVEAPADKTCSQIVEGAGAIVTYAIEHKAELSCKTLEVIQAKAAK